jgi:uncharacterized membrane protein
MEGWLEHIAKNVTLIVDAMALLIISIGPIEAFFAVVRVLLISSATNEERRTVWVRYARWLIAGLTFQLAADIIATSVAPNWDSIGRLGAIAVIRTFLDIFLERDIAEARRLLCEQPRESSPLK